MKIITLCASHIDNIQRLDYLRQMINSRYNLETKSEFLIISISWTKSMKNVTQSVITKFPSDVIVYQSDTKLSQFEHYKNILDKHNWDSSCDDIWFDFVDDDDEVLMDRYDFFHKLFDTASDAYKDNFAVRGAYYYRNNTQIEDLHGMGELWLYIIPKSTFEFFIVHAPPGILRHKFCDMYFRDYLKLFIQVFTIPFEIPIYFYRVHENSISNTTYHPSWFLPKNIVHENIDLMHLANNVELFYFTSIISNTNMVDLLDLKGVLKIEHLFPSRYMKHFHKWKDRKSVV